MSVPRPDLQDKTLLAEGAWSEDGVAWLPRSLNPTRHSARKMYASLSDFAFEGLPLSALRVSACFIQHWTDTPYPDEYEDEAAWWDGGYWRECAREDKGAVAVWKVAAPS